MPYLLYPPNATSGTKPASAEEHLGPVDQARVETKGRRRRRLTKSRRSAPTSSSTPESSLLYAVTRRASKEVLTETGTPQAETREDEEAYMMSGASQERRTVAQIREQMAQRKEETGGNDGTKPVKSPSMLKPGETPIYTYTSGNETSATANAQLDHELLREIKNWVGIGDILRTSQVSVTSEQGICVDEKGERVYFPPRWNLPLFPWEDDVSRSGSTKSKDSSGKGSLEYVMSEYAAVFEVADRYQAEDQPD